MGAQGLAPAQRRDRAYLKGKPAGYFGGGLIAPQIGIHLGLGRPHVIDKLAAKSSIGKRFYVPDDWVTSDRVRGSLGIRPYSLVSVATKAALREPHTTIARRRRTSGGYVPDLRVVTVPIVPVSRQQLSAGCACAAFPALVAVGAGLITTNPALKTVLLVGVDMIHRLTDPNDPGCFLWSGGAGAAVLEGGSRRALSAPLFRPMAPTRQGGAFSPTAPSNRPTSTVLRTAAP